ncbi:hypothetical protein [Streptomyces calidiresistens]|nr:hypothetical protein [Streptomyces calidiresistens]
MTAMDLKIAHTSPEALRERNEITTVHTGHDDPDYEDGAVLPADAWQPLTDEHLTAVTADRHTPDHALVELVALPVGAAPTHLADLVAPLGDPDAVHLGRSHSPADARTTTCNGDGGQRIGLHIDNWDRHLLAARHRSRRRLCYNLGPGDRHLLLATIDIRTICRALQSTPDHQPHTDDFRRYIATGHTTHCVRIRIHPGEGYIAPTELFPHDGATHKEPHPSTTAHWLGHWPANVLERLI